MSEDQSGRPRGTATYAPPTILMGPPPGFVEGATYGQPDAQAFLVTMLPGSHLEVHFHQVDQFQVFVGGGARFERDAVRRGIIHYADAYRPYGPLDTATEEISFWTLRNVSDCGLHSMPAQQDELRDALRDSNRPRRSMHLDAIEAATAGTWSWPVAESDGVGVGVIRLLPNTEVSIPTVGSGGAYLVTVEGALQGITPDCPGQPTNRWLAPEYEGTITASHEGAVVALLRFASR